MTNLILEAIITLVAVTNWTGVNIGTNELGYIATNHMVSVVYQEETKVFELKSVPSNCAVWRERKLWAITNIHTNYIWPPPGALLLTNRW